MAAFLLLLLFGDGARPDLPKPKPEIRRYDPTPAPATKLAPPARPKKETAAERRKRLAQEKKQMDAVLKVLSSEKSMGLLGVLRADSPESVFGRDGSFDVGKTTPPPPADDREAIHRVVRAHTGAVRFCYEKELAQKPDLAGRVATRFAIDATGAVTEAVVTSSSLADTAVESCLLRQIRSWKFPAKATTVVYPFRFENGG